MLLLSAPRFHRAVLSYSGVLCLVEFFCVALTTYTQYILHSHSPPKLCPSVKLSIRIVGDGVGDSVGRDAVPCVGFLGVSICSAQHAALGPEVGSILNPTMLLAKHRSVEAFMTASKQVSSSHYATSIL